MQKILIKDIQLSTSTMDIIYISLIKMIVIFILDLNQQIT